MRKMRTRSFPYEAEARRTLEEEALADMLNDGMLLGKRDKEVKMAG